MTTASEMLALAAKVEAATGADRKLDAAIWLHLPEQEGHAWKHSGNRLKHAVQIAGCSFIPAFTASLDAAMTLMPEGFHFGCGSIDVTGKAWAWVGKHGHADDDLWLANAATPALALIAASLRASAALLQASRP